MARKPQYRHQSPSRPYSSRSPTDNCYRQTPYWKRPHTSNYKHSFWRTQWRDKFNKRTPTPQRHYHVPSFTHDLRNKLNSKTNTEADLTNHRNTEPPKSPQTDLKRPFRPDRQIKNYSNLESTDRIEPVSSKTIINSKSATLGDMSLSSASGNNLFSPSDYNNSISCESVSEFHLYQSVKNGINLPEELPRIKETERSKLQNSHSKDKKSMLNNTVDYKSSNYCDTIFNPFDTKLLQSREFDCSRLQDTCMKHKNNNSKKLLANKLLKYDTFLKLPHTSSMTSSKTKRTNLHKSPSKLEGTKSSKSLHSDCVKRREARTKLPDTKEVKHWDSKLTKIEASYWKHKKSSSKKPVGFKSSKYCDFSSKSSVTKSMNLSDTVSSKLANSSLTPVTTRKSKYSDDNVSSTLENTHFKTTKTQSLKSRNYNESITLHESSLKSKETEPNKHLEAKYLERCGAILEPKESKSIKHRDIQSKMHDLSLMVTRENISKFLDKERSTLFDASIKPKDTTMVKSVILSCGAENIKPCDSSLGYPKSKFNKKRSLKEVLKCYDDPLKSSYQSLMSPQNSTNTTNEDAPKNTIDANSSTRCYSALSPPETKSKRAHTIDRENHRISNLKYDELKSSKSLSANCVNPHYFPLNPREPKVMESTRDPVNTKPQQSSRFEDVKLKNSLGSDKIPVDANLIRPRGDASKRKQDIVLRPEETILKKPIHDKRVKQSEDITNSTNTESILLCAGKNTQTELRDFSVKPKEAYSTKFVKKTKCLDVPSKYSSVKKMESCCVKVVKLPDPLLKHEETKLQNTFIPKCSKRHKVYSKSRDTESTKHQGEAKSNKSLSAGSSNSTYTSLRTSEGKSVKSRHTESTNCLESSTNVKEYNLKKSYGSKTSKGHYAYLKSLEDKSVKSRDTQSKTLNPNSKPEVTNSKKPLYAVATKRNNTHLKPSNAVTATNFDTECIKDKSRELSQKSYVAKTKNPFQKIVSKCVHVPSKNMEATSMRLGGDERYKISNSSLKRKASDENKSLEYLEAEMSRMFRTSPNPAKAKQNNIFEIDSSKHIEDECIMSSKNKFRKLLETENTIICPVEQTLLKGSIQVELPNHRTGEYVLPKKSEPSKNTGHETRTTDKMSEHRLNSSSAIKHLTSKGTKCHRVVSSVKSNEADSISSYTLDHRKLAEKKRLGPEGISPYEVGSLEQLSLPAMKPGVSQTKKFIGHERHASLPKPIKCVKYTNTHMHSPPQSIIDISEISAISKPNAMNENPSEDCQSKRFDQESYNWTSKLKICGIHLIKQQCTTSEISFDSVTTKIIESVSATPPTTHTNLTNTTESSTVESNQLINTDCSLSTESTSLQHIASKNSNVSCKHSDPNLSTSKSTLLPEECNKLSHSKNNNAISEVCHSDSICFPSFGYPICYSPVTPPKVGYASSSSKSPDPSAYYGSPLEL